MCPLPMMEMPLKDWIAVNQPLRISPRCRTSMVVLNRAKIPTRASVEFSGSVHNGSKRWSRRWKLVGHPRPSGGEAGCVDVSVAHSVVFDGLVKRRLQSTLDCAINRQLFLLSG